MGKYRVEVIDRVHAAVLASKTPAERIAMMDAMHRYARTTIAARVKQVFPDATPAEHQREFLRRLLGHGSIRDIEACCRIAGVN
jgi:hypothetical protein